MYPSEQALAGARLVQSPVSHSLALCLSCSAFKVIDSTLFKYLIYIIVLLHSGLTFIEPPSLAM